MRALLRNNQTLGQPKTCFGKIPVLKRILSSGTAVFTPDETLLQEKDPLALCRRQDRMGVCSPITAPVNNAPLQSPSQPWGIAGCSPRMPFSRVGNQWGNHRSGFQYQHGPYLGRHPGQTSLASTLHSLPFEREHAIYLRGGL